MFATKFSWTGKYGKYHIYTDSDESLATLLIKDYLRRSLGKNIDEVDDPRIFKVKISEKMYQKKNISVIYIMKEILESHPVKNLKAIIRTLKVEVTGFSTMKKSALVNKILELKKKGFPVPNVKMYQKPGRKAPAPKAKPPPAPAPAPAKKAKFKVVKQAKKPANNEKASSFLADIEQKGKSVSEKVKKTQDVKPEMQKEKPKKGGLRNESKLVGKILGIHDQKVRGRYYSATFRKIVAIKNNKLQLVKSDATGKPILGRTGKETKTQMTLEKLESYLQHKEKRHAHIYEPTPESLKDDSRAMLLGGKDGEGKAITDMFLK